MDSVTHIASRGSAASGPPSTLPRFGNWQAVSLLGQGRWAAVYRACPCDRTDPDASVYAVKTVRLDVRDPSTAIRLLQREALVARAVAHPHLTCILAAQTRRSPAHLVMPYLEGAGLNQRLVAGRQLDTPLALWIARQTAEALAALHQNGWLHSDVKPANVFVSRGGHATLLDLGLARRLTQGAKNHEAAITGTLAYTAPEFFASILDIGPASDVYSLGITLYQMLAGRLPFPTQDASQLIAAHAHRAPPDPRGANPRISPRVIQLLRRMLAKQPVRRPSVDQLIAELTDLEIDTFDERSAA